MALIFLFLNEEPEGILGPWQEGRLASDWGTPSHQLSMQKEPPLPWGAALPTPLSLPEQQGGGLDRATLDHAPVLGGSGTYSSGAKLSLSRDLGYNLA